MIPCNRLLGAEALCTAWKGIFPSSLKNEYLCSSFCKNKWWFWFKNTEESFFAYKESSCIVQLETKKNRQLSSWKYSSAAQMNAWKNSCLLSICREVLCLCPRITEYGRMAVTESFKNMNYFLLFLIAVMSVCVCGTWFFGAQFHAELQSTLLLILKDTDFKITC